MTDIPGFLGAGAAGVLSFFSPCVLPLLPSYLVFLTGSGVDALRSGASDLRGIALKRTLSFILGFSLVFIVLGIVFASAQTMLGAPTVIIGRVAGGIVILLGLNLAFNFIGLLNREARFHARKKPENWIGAVLTGAAFAAGWSPCIGPILASILLLAAQGSVARSAGLLAVYSAGFALPFLVMALFFGWTEKLLKRLNPHMDKIRIISGLTLAAIGIGMWF